MSSYLIDLGIVLILIAGISKFRTPRGARVGNWMAAAALAAAVAVVLGRYPPGSIGLVLVAVAAGAVSGSVVARRVGMIQIPAMVAFQNGMGGLAALLISYVELTRHDGVSPPPVAEVSALLGLVTGAATFSGSLIAVGKLTQRVRRTPVLVPKHNAVIAILGSCVVFLILRVATFEHATTASVIGIAICSTALGIVFSVRVGGADMPVLISFLNATTGLAAALCGVAVGSRLLVACGATVAASGFILTLVMCRAMNRGLVGVFSGIQSPPLDSAVSETRRQPEQNQSLPADMPQSGGESLDPFTRALAALRSADQIIIIPGYGMALADAQEEVVQLGEKLAHMGKRVRFAIHPVAGRMPGHMHVLLAEAEVDYELIAELEDINADFAQTDLALVVGACDVVNSAALEANGTPISGMPILRADEARDVIVCNLDDQPGYSGVENPLYRNPRAIMLLGDAKLTVSRLIEEVA
ncbi:MAG: NAD(P)(+) transhydrogenase (Re/Si-specific) subunit beta [Planctomycetota bacterium]